MCYRHGNRTDHIETARWDVLATPSARLRSSKEGARLQERFARPTGVIRADKNRDKLLAIPSLLALVIYLNFGLTDSKLKVDPFSF